jgi:Tfp pilus assembly protein FimT
MKRFAFTMLELVFVIIVIGILAVLAMPSFNSNPLQKAAEQVAGHIRYTQHLAMVDDKFDPNDQLWFRENWQIEFVSTASNVWYKIYSDMDHLGNSDNATHREPALDPLTGDTLDGNSDITDLKKKYAIKSVIFSANCKGNGTGKELAFDALGRPYFYITIANPPVTNMNQYLLTSDCNITLVHQNEGNATITVRPETGYVSISYN